MPLGMMEDRYEEESRRLNFPVFPDITDIRLMRPVGTLCRQGMEPISLFGLADVST